jgi:hypothetical protein
LAGVQVVINLISLETAAVLPVVLVVVLYLQTQAVHQQPIRVMQAHK